MISTATLAAIRFGYGLGPSAGAHPPETMLAGLALPDAMAQAYPVKPSHEAVRIARAYRRAKRAAGKAGAKDNPDLQEMRTNLRAAAGLGLVQGMARILETPVPFRERLVWFWADHFTAVARNAVGKAVAPAYIDEAIRPHVAGTFADMLKAVVTHPFMLSYLDQASSTGPNSAIGKRRGRGLNENLAREVLELHTLGLGAGYSQDDVRQMAELMTGLTVTKNGAFEFNPRMAEDGSETILGRTYGGGRPTLADVFAALDDLAMHPFTARHLAQKLAVHFVADDVQDSLVEHLGAAYLASGGKLMAMYAALLEHPAAWAPELQKAKRPFDFIASALVALNLPGKRLAGLEPNELNRLLFRPLADMGQPFMGSRGPDGWPETADAWITPQGLASRISWAAAVAGKAGGRAGAPARFLEQTLADAAGPRLSWAVRQTNDPAEGVTLVFASAEFNRR